MISIQNLDKGAEKFYINFIHLYESYLWTNINYIIINNFII